MSRPPRSRLAWSSESGRVCATCGWPVDDCRCSSEAADPVPERIVARLRIERSGRKGKTVTVVGGLPGNDAFLGELASDLKRACGSGGTVRRGPAGENGVEIQGDHREAIRRRLGARGWTVKG